MADLKRFTPKSKPVTYTGVLVELYNQKNCGQVDEIHGIVELEKIRTLIAKNSRNFGTHRIIVRYFQFYVILIWSLGIKTELCSMSIIILIGINMILTR